MAEPFDPTYDEAMEALGQMLEQEAAESRSILGIQRRLDVASEGPWRLQIEQSDEEFSTNPPYPYALIGPTNQMYADKPPESPLYDHRAEVSEISEMTMEDAEFLVHAREDIPRLLAAFDALLLLVTLKEMKERGTDLDLYAKVKPGAWEDAKRAVADLLPPSVTTPLEPDKVAAMIPAFRKALAEQEGEPSDG